MIILLILLNTTPFNADRVEIVKENGANIVYLLGNVEIQHGDTRIFCNEAQLNETRGTVLLKDSILIKDEDSEIRAENAIYYLGEKVSILRGNVKLNSADQVISADSLNYDGERRYITMYHNVRLEDLRNHLIAYGGEGCYDLNTEIGSLMVEPKLEIFRDDKMPITITAREFLIKNKEEICYGYDSVAGVIDSINLFCDTITYNIKTHNGSMVNPVVMEKNNELKGLSGEFGLKDNTIEYFKIFSGVANYWTEEGSHNIIMGNSIKIFFQEGRAFKVRIEGEPKGKLYLKEQKENAGD
ncbi:MAG: LptA/OstA family protein [bacterium]